MKKYLTILFFLLASNTIDAQSNCFARVALDKHSVYIQQPFKITITVLTPTWYTAPLDFDNIQIPNSFILPFSRTIPGMFDVNGKKYAGLQFYFIVFPYKAGSFTVPSINIIAQTPPEGSGVSKKVTIKTLPQHFTVKPVPANIETGNWFVAKNVFVHERWSKPLHNLKVGDMVERTVTINAAGTLPQFIPQLQKDSLAFASVYLQDAELQDKRNDYDANGELTQSIIYLLEKEGDFTIPAVEVKWWNPNSSKLYSRKAFAGKIHVAANPNLGMLATLKDSLAAKQIVPVSAPVSKTRTIFGIAWYWALLIGLVGLLIVYRLVRRSIKIWRYGKEKYARYLESETHAFRRLMRSPLSLKVLLGRMYYWWDRFAIPGKYGSVSQQMREEKNQEAGDELGKYLQTVYQAGDVDGKADPLFKKNLRAYRRNAKQGKTIVEEDAISIYQSAYQLKQ